MPISWTADVNEKLLHAIVNQLYTNRIKLDSKDLAAFMGPGCTPFAIDNQLVKLRRKAVTMTGPQGDNNSTSNPSAGFGRSAAPRGRKRGATLNSVSKSTALSTTVAAPEKRARLGTGDASVQGGVTGETKDEVKVEVKDEDDERLKDFLMRLFKAEPGFGHDGGDREGHAEGHARDGHAEGDRKGHAEGHAEGHEESETEAGSEAGNFLAGEEAKLV